MQDLERWVIEELGHAQFGDERLTKRFMREVERFGRPSRGHSPASVRGCGRD